MKQHYQKTEAPITPLGHSIDGTARRLGISRTKTYDLLNQGLLEAVKIGDRTIVTEPSIQKLIATAPSYQPKGGVA
jgi:hypothetical protein